MTEDVIIRLIAEGVARSETDINRVGGAVENLGQSAAGAAAPVADLEGSLGGVNDAAGAAGPAVDDAAGSVEDLGDAADDTSTSTGGLVDALEKTRNAGLVMAGIGAGGLAITQGFIDASVEGDGLEKKLESILTAQGRINDLDGINDAIGDVTAQGHFDDDDGLRDASIHLASFSVESEHLAELLPRVARQVRTGFGDLTSVADGLGKAYSNLDLAPLARSGLIFTDAEKAAVEYAKGLDEAAGRAAFMAVVTKAIDRNTVSLEDSLTDAEAAANDLANAMDGAMTTMGAGAGEAQSHVNSVLASIISVVNEAPALQYAAGYLGYFGSFALTAVGGLLSVGSQIGLTIISMQGLGITASGVWTSFTAGAVAAGTATWAALAPLLPLILAIGAAALVTTAAIYYLSGAKQAMDQAAADKVKGDEADRQYYEIDKAAAAKKGKQFDASYEDWAKRTGRGAENSDDSEAMAPPPDLSGLEKQIANIGNGQGMAPPMPAMPSPTITPAPATAMPAMGGTTFDISSAPAAKATKAKADADPANDFLAAFLMGQMGGPGKQFTEPGSKKGEGKGGAGKDLKAPISFNVEDDPTAGSIYLHLVAEPIVIPRPGGSGSKTLRRPKR